MDPSLGEVVNDAIVDDLVLLGPEIIMGQILEVCGLLDKDGYNPILIAMEAVLRRRLHEAPTETAVEAREHLKRRFPIPATRWLKIWTINCLGNSWQRSGRFNGALLWREHWDGLLSDDLGQRVASRES